MTKKIRADQLLVQLGLAPTRTRAQSLIMSGVVYCETERINKSSELFLPNTPLTLKGSDHPYVGRGGLKLKAALDTFKIDVTDKICVDVGASTGGFTDCLLQSGAKKIYAIDVGYGQLDWSLQKNPQVVVMDRTNFRLLDPLKILDPIDLVVIDASFISLTLLISKALEILSQNYKPDQILVFLIKPQFEVGRSSIGKKGIVVDPHKHEECIQKIRGYCLELKLTVIGVIPSPILGQEGNKEFLMVCKIAYSRV